MSIKMKKMDGKFNEKAKEGLPRPSFQQNYTHEEVQAKMASYRSVAKTKEHRAKMVEMRNNYLKQAAKDNINREVQDFYFKIGKEAGISNHITQEERAKGIAEIGQFKRNMTMKEVKGYYHQNYSLKKNFKEANNREDRGKGIIGKGMG